MRLLLDEMYSPMLAQALSDAGIDALTVADLRMTGAPDAGIFAVARMTGRALLTENVGAFTRLAAEQATAGGQHSGLLIALSSRFSRRAAGVRPLDTAIRALADGSLDDRVIYLRPPFQRG